MLEVRKYYRESELYSFFKAAIYLLIKGSLVPMYSSVSIKLAGKTLYQEKPLQQEILTNFQK
jgi:predicted ABC-type exoprotein transport system permease subunit